MRALRSKQGRRRRNRASPVALLLAISVHQVLAPSRLTGGSIQKSQPTTAALPDSRRIGHQTSIRTGADAAAFGRPASEAEADRSWLLRRQGGCLGQAWEPGLGLAADSGTAALGLDGRPRKGVAVKHDRPAGMPKPNPPSGSREVGDCDALDVEPSLLASGCPDGVRRAIKSADASLSQSAKRTGQLVQSPGNAHGRCGHAPERDPDIRASRGATAAAQDHRRTTMTPKLLTTGIVHFDTAQDPTT